MEINAQEVIDRLSNKLAKLEAEKTVMEVQLEMLQSENSRLSAQIPRDNDYGDAPYEGELIDG